MTTWLTIHESLEDAQSDILSWKQENINKTSTPMMILSFVVLSFAEDLIELMCIEIESKKELCASCFAINMESIFMSLERYMLLEQENLKAEGKKEEIMLILKTIKTCKDISTYLHKQHGNLEKCVRSINPAYVILNNTGNHSEELYN